MICKHMRYGGEEFDDWGTGHKEEYSVQTCARTGEECYGYCDEHPRVYNGPKCKVCGKERPRLDGRTVDDWASYGCPECDTRGKGAWPHS